MSEAQQQLESILIADCGSARTKLVLIDAIDGQYRFVAYTESPSTVNDTWDDISVGVVDAIGHLQEITGRTFLGDDGQLLTPETETEQGIDHFYVVSSAAEPLCVVLAGLTRDISLASARRAALSTYVRIGAELALEQAPTRAQPLTDDDKINAIWHASPDVICVVGGTDGGAEASVLEMVRSVVAVALYLMGGGAPSVIYAGNNQLHDAVTQDIGEFATLHIVDNVRPRPGVENIIPLSEEIELAFYQRKLRYLPGADTLNRWSRAPILPTAQTADYAVRYCDRAWNPDKAALRVDIGSASVTMNVCVGGRPLTTVRDDLGMGYGLAKVVDQVDMGDILRWLPFDLDPSEARDRLMNKALKPQSIPQTREDLLLEYAAAREAVRLVLRDVLPGWPGPIDLDPRAGMIPPCDPLVACGGLLAHVPYHGYAAMLLLDALQPVGINALYLDEYNLLASLGAVVNAQPLAMVQTLRSGGLTFMGTAVVPSGAAGQGDRVLAVRSPDRGVDVNIQVRYGELVVVPLQHLDPGTEIQVVPTRGFDVGLGPGRSAKIADWGGTVGLIVDARGRPLDFDRNPQVQQSRMDGWLLEMMGV
jgi:hypothetical protein